MAKKMADQRLIPKPGHLVVRMYRQGLGDCFLLAFGGVDNAARYMLIDCGVHTRQKDGTRRLGEVLEDLVVATGGHLDVVVATHEHADHLSGFVQKGSPFLSQKLTVGELWLAWTEKVGDQQADTLREKRGTARAVIAKAVKEARQRNAAVLADTTAGLNDFESTDEQSVDWDAAGRLLAERAAAGSREAAAQRVQQMLDGTLGEGNGVGVAAAAKKERKKPTSNELALGLLAALASHVEYANPGKVLELPYPDQGRCFVLGPPRDPLFLKKDLPTKIGNRSEGNGGKEGQYKEVYLSGEDGGQAFQLSPALGADTRSSGLPDGVPADSRFPFDVAHRRRFEKARLQWTGGARTVPEQTRELFKNHYLTGGDWRRIDADWLGTAEELALNLDSDTNNTSLVLALEWGPVGEGPVLLFPGDAQVGNWLSWRKQDYQVERRTIKADDLLKRTIVYKVGHHGSHNATVRRDPGQTTAEHPLGVPFGLELMDNIIALIPVDREAAERKMPISWDMPYAPLYKKLRDKAQRRVLRSDDTMKPLEDTEKDLTPTATDWTPTPGLKGVQWRKAARTFSLAPQGALYYDVLLEPIKR
jgi:beta-lactamase superfamily II metal-dependent hydrolase